MINTILHKKAHLILFIFNMILLLTGWVMTSYAFTRLPAAIPLWLPFSGQPAIFFKKSFLFFIYPSVQTLFFVVFLLMAHIFINRENLPALYKEASLETQKKILLLEKEFVLLVLIFFNLVFIHIQRSLILLAHGLETGISPLYFYSLFGIILLLIPYFQMRRKTILMVSDNDMP